ncbi:MAG TPA: ATP-binding protein [Steroidobacteraceae bacterium]|jgi:signal transduction histidine kinase|nr:ATP-binding protein [Steroidobacteraceae bacterium]
MGGEDIENGGRQPDAAATLEAVGMLVEQGDLKSLCARVVDVAAELLAADCASIQTRIPDRPQLQLVAARGFVPEAAAFWDRVDASSNTPCGRALSRGERIIVPDVERDDRLAGTEDLRQMRLCGIRAVQSTPLLSRGGEPLGMLSTHWRREYDPPAKALLLADALARQVARLIERAAAEEARRATETSLRLRVEALERTDREKNSFLAMVAHELRSPLAPVRNVGEVLAQVLRNHPGALRPLAILKRQTSQLSRLVDDLLDISRIQQGRLMLQERPVEIGEILDQALETVQPLLREQLHDLVVERLRAPAFVLGDSARLVQCVANLLQNAAKYTHPGGHIRLAVAAAGAKVSISVRDDGAGIAPALLPHIFEPFVQSKETREHARGGLGIGLAIVKRLVEMHGGSVEAVSEGEGHGSMFTVHLWRLDWEQTPGGSGMATAGARPKQILVVDAHPDAADTVAAILAAKGHRVESAYSALSALADAQRLRPDAILLDLDLPRMSGYEVARRLRARPELRATLLVALSGNKDDEAAARAAGFHRFLSKPIDIVALERVLA